MRLIKKSPNGQGQKELSLIIGDLHSTPDATVSYDRGMNAKHRRIILQNLLEDQGFICAYCMRRLKLDGTGDTEPHIEHYLVRNPNEEYRAKLPPDTSGYDEDRESLNYRNLFAVCNGGSEQKKNKTDIQEKCCDKSRPANKPLHISPLRKHDIDSIYYTTDGKIHSTNPDFDYDLDIALNLNCEKLSFPQNRQAVLRAMQDSVIASNNQLNRQKMRQIAQDLGQAGKPLPAYAGILIWWLEKKGINIPYE